jgi:hypothetical protein
MGAGQRLAGNRSGEGGRARHRGGASSRPPTWQAARQGARSRPLRFARRRPRHAHCCNDVPKSRIRLDFLTVRVLVWAVSDRLGWFAGGGGLTH